MNRHSSRKTVNILAALALIAALAAGCGNTGGEGLTLISRYGQGELYTTPGGTYPVVVLRGDWYEMGRQYGGLLADDLRRFHDEITADVEARGTGRAAQAATALEIYNGYSPNLRLLLGGLAETSGLTHSQVLALNAGMILLTQAALGGEPPAACSGIAAWGKYTPDGGLVFGRNWDIEREPMLPYMKYLAAVVFNPEEGASFVNVHPLGNVYLETGLNSHGVLIELNNAEYSDPEFYEDREDTSSFLVQVLLESENLDQAVDLLRNKPADVSYALQIADAHRAVSLERPTFGSRVREGDHGLLAAYNSFVPPYPADWDGLVSPPMPTDQDPRYDNLIALANSNRFYGRLNPPGMMDLLEVPIERGGALHDGTVVQVVAVPETLTIWLRGVEHSDFEKVELAGLFDN